MASLVMVLYWRVIGAKEGHESIDREDNYDLLNVWGWSGHAHHIHSQDFAGYYYRRRLLGGLWMSICGHNSSTYTHGRIKDVLIQLPYPHGARASN
jgi:hypothetical protein